MPRKKGKPSEANVEALLQQQVKFNKSKSPQQVASAVQRVAAPPKHQTTATTTNRELNRLEQARRRKVEATQQTRTDNLALAREAKLQKQSIKVAQNILSHVTGQNSSQSQPPNNSNNNNHNNNNNLHNNESVGLLFARIRDAKTEGEKARAMAELTQAITNNATMSSRSTSNTNVLDIDEDDSPIPQRLSFPRIRPREPGNEENILTRAIFTSSSVPAPLILLKFLQLNVISSRKRVFPSLFCL